MMSKLYAIILIISLLAACPINTATFSNIGMGIAIAGSTVAAARNLLIAYRLHNKGEGYKTKLEEMNATITDKKKLIGHNTAKTGYWVKYPSDCLVDRMVQINQLSEKLNATYMREQRNVMSGIFFGLISVGGLYGSAIELRDTIRSRQQ